MTNASTSLRALLVYTAILPLALLIGYLMATPTDLSSMAVVGMVLVVLSIPLMLKWHRPILFLTWNMTAVLFFLPGRPQIWVAAAFLSFGFMVVQRMMVLDFKSISARSVTLSILFLLLVVFGTAKLTGGVGLRAFGSDVVGGKAYFWILAGALGYFAMTAYPIPPERRMLYVGLFLLGALTNAIGSSLDVLTPSFYYIFLVFPVDKLPGSGGSSISRYGGLALAAMAMFFYLLARNRLRDIVSGRKMWALIFCVLCSLIVLGSGYRSHFILIALVALGVFYLEGLCRTPYLVALVLGGVLAMALAVPLARSLPMSVQRALSILPFPVAPEARLEAERSNEWRINMWKSVLPEVPKYLWLGKGLAVSGAELEMTEQMGAFGATSQFEAAAQVGSYHNGALTVLIPFGIWGFVGWLWFVSASMRALYLNYKYGDPDLKSVNTLLLSLFAAKILLYFAVFGEFRVDFPTMAGIIGLGLALNGGISKPVRGANEAISGVIPRLNATNMD